MLAVLRQLLADFPQSEMISCTGIRLHHFMACMHALLISTGYPALSATKHVVDDAGC